MSAAVLTGELVITQQPGVFTMADDSINSMAIDAATAAASGATTTGAAAAQQTTAQQNNSLFAQNLAAQNVLFQQMVTQQNTLFQAQMVQQGAVLAQSMVAVVNAATAARNNNTIDLEVLSGSITVIP